MSTKAQKTKEYQVYAVIHSWVSIGILAKDLDEAVAKSKNLEESDFVDTLGECIDGDFRIVGVQESDIDCH